MHTIRKREEKKGDENEMIIIHEVQFGLFQNKELFFLLVRCDW